MRGYKGFDGDLSCKGYQFEVGKEYIETKAECCKQGFHFCEKLTDVFGYYPLALSRFCEVEGGGMTDVKGDKVAVTELKIIRELSIKEVLETCLEEAKVKKTDNSISTSGKDCSVSANTGHCSVSANTGNCSTSITTRYRSASVSTGDGSTPITTEDFSVSANTGNYSTSMATGDYSVSVSTGHGSISATTGEHSTAVNTGDNGFAINSGDNGISINTGSKGRAKANKGNWLVLANWEGGYITDVKSVLVDGHNIKSDTFYKLVNGEFKEVE